MKILEKNLDIVKDILRKDMDFFMVVDGYEGLGKTTLALEICNYIDDDFNLGKLAFTGDEFIGVLRNAEPYSAVLLDEGGTVLFSRRAMDEMNKRIVELLMTIRAKNLFFCLCLPNIFWLDVYARKHRVGALAHVTKRGRFSFYSKRRIGQMLKENMYGRPNFTESFRSLDGNELWDQYQEKKFAFVDAKLGNEPRCSRKTYFIPKEIADFEGKSVGTVRNWINLGVGNSPNASSKLPAVRLADGRMVVKKDEYRLWREEKYLPQIRESREIQREILRSGREKWRKMRSGTV